MLKNNKICHILRTQALQQAFLNTSPTNKNTRLSKGLYSLPKYRHIPLPHRGCNEVKRSNVPLRNASSKTDIAPKLRAGLYSILVCLFVSSATC